MDIEEWWPNVVEAVRRQLVNHPWDPVAPFCIDEVEKAGGPAFDSGWWQPMRDWPGELGLPREAHLWIIAQHETSALREPPERDPRADYMGRGWWRR